MNADDLQRELDRLWSKASDISSEEPAPLPPSLGFGESVSPTREASIEAIGLIKRQRQEEIAGWQEMLSLKEAAAADLAARLRAAQAEVLELREAENQKDVAAMSEVIEVAHKLEEAGAALKAAEQRAAQDEARLRGLLTKSREQAAAETARWRELERRWQEREQQYLIELKESQTVAARAQRESAAHEDKSRKFLDDLRQGKTAVEATLAELLQERKLREVSDAERDKALRKVAEVEAHFQDLQHIWEEERRQWQQLWDREHATWETQRQELAAWEMRLRREREQWLAELKTKEEAELRYADQMARTLRESSEAGTSIARTFKALAGVPDLAAAAVARASRRRWWRAAAALAILLAAAFPVWRHAHRLRLTPVASQVVSIENPTSLTYDGGALWVCEWSGALASLDPANPSRVLARYRVTGAGSYHPSSLTLGGDALWSLDAAQARVLKHGLSDPSIPQDAWASPGPAPTAIAHDGRNLWSYDAVTKTLYRHLGEGQGAEVNAFPIEEDVVLTSMDWSGGLLWMHDSKGRQILRYRLVEKSLKLVDRTAFDPSVLSISIVAPSAGRARQLWALTAPGQGSRDFQLKRFQVE